MGRRGLLVLGCLAALASVLLGARLVQVHQATWAWSLRMPEAPPKTHALGREFLKGHPARPDELPVERVQIGLTEGGAPIYAQPPRDEVPIRAWVVTRNGDLWHYGLSGGP